jgi:uncharacterized membrane protein YphA (DoxX/SURF4 family)
MLDFLTSPYFILFARLCVGGVFLVSSVGKLLDRPGTAASMARYPFLPVASRKLVADYFPYLELVVAVALILGIFTRYAAIAAVGLFVVFTALIIYDLTHNQSASCHCFGRLSEEKLTPMAVVRNVALIVLSLAVWAAFDGWLSLDASLNSATNGSLGLVAGGSSSVASMVDAVPVGLLALVTVGVVVLGGRAIDTVRTTLRGIGFRA